MRGAARRAFLRLGAGLAAGTLALVAGGLGLAGCHREPPAPDYRDVPADPVPLMDGFESYATVADVKAKLLHATLMEDFERPSRRGSPPYEHVLLQASDFFHLDRGGVLELRFFNDRLMETVFWPREPGNYSARLRDVLTARGFEVGAARSGEQWEAEMGHAVVRSRNDLDGLRFAWHDERLTAQEVEWTMRYGRP